jgi:hypothetical protein
MYVAFRPTLLTQGVLGDYHSAPATTLEWVVASDVTLIRSGL